MITFIKGKLVEISPSLLVMECYGVGYEIIISLSTYSQIKDNQSEFIIYIHHHIREDAELLYGFHTKAERELFQNLISVNGIGPSSAISMLSSSNSRDLTRAISDGDIDALKSTKGIGIKTAQRIIIELKDKLGENISDSNELSLSSKNEALSALEVLGINRKQSEPIVNKYLEKHPNSTVEELIKITLKKK